MIHFNTAHTRLRASSGFSLVEVIIALLILALFIVIFLRSETQKWLNLGRTKYQNAAIELIQNKIEGKRAAIRANPTAFPNPNTTDPAITQNGITLSTAYFAAIGKQTPPDTLPNVRRVKLTATWTANGKPDTLSVETYVARGF